NRKILRRRRGTGKVQDPVEWSHVAQGLDHVLLKKRKTRIRQRRCEIGEAACREIVHRDHLVACGEEMVHQMAAYEARSAGDEDSHLYPHSYVLKSVLEQPVTIEEIAAIENQARMH